MRNRDADRKKARPAVEALESKTLLAASIGGMHKVVLDTGAVVTVERNDFHRDGGNISLDLQVRSGGRRFNESYRLNASGTPVKGSRVAANDVITLFLLSASSRASGSSGTGVDTQDTPNLGVISVQGSTRGDNSTVSATFTSPGVRLTQSVKTRQSLVRGAFPNNNLTSTDALNLLGTALQDKLTPKATAKPKK
jgi:hypothetical protein